MSTEKEILKGTLSVIATIADPQLQHEAWMSKSNNLYDFFEEKIHQLFDDYEISEIVINFKDYGISNSQYTSLYKFYKAIDQYSEEKMSWLGVVDAQEVLKDPRWHEIQEKARNVLTAFNYQKKINKMG